MADIDLKTETPDTTLPTTGFLFGADSQAAASPSVYSTQTVATTLLGSTTLTGATVTTSSPVIDAAQTWNDGGTTFTGLKFNATDTASASGSLLMDLQVGGVSRFRVEKGGRVLAFSLASSAEAFNTAGRIVAGSIVVNNTVGAAGSTFYLSSQSQLQWSSNTVWSGSPDLFLTRRAAANLRLGAADAAAPVAQTLSVQSVVAGTTDTAGANLTITGSQGTGTGAGGSIIFQVAPAGSTSNSVQNALATAWTVDSASRLIGSSGGTAAAPAVSLPNNVGLFAPATNTLAFSLEGVERGRFEGALGFGLARDSWLWWSNNTSNGNYSNRDTILARDAANTLALRNGANAQTFRVYNTYTSATDFERGNIYWDSNVLKIGTEKGSTGGTARALEFQTDGTSRWSIGATTGHLLAGTDNTYDIGASGANRPRNVYVAGAISAGGPSLNSPATDVMRLYGATNGAALQLVEMTAPAAPSTNNVRIYAEDNGSGKTRLMALFPTGAAVQIAIEP